MGVGVAVGVGVGVAVALGVGVGVGAITLNGNGLCVLYATAGLLFDDIVQLADVSVYLAAFVAVSNNSFVFVTFVSGTDYGVNEAVYNAVPFTNLKLVRFAFKSS